MSAIQHDRDAISSALLSSLGTVYDCKRTWSAWSQGTMGPDDFVPFDMQDDRIEEVVDAVIAALPSPQASDVVLQRLSERIDNILAIAEFVGLVGPRSRVGEAHAAAVRFARALHFVAQRPAAQEVEPLHLFEFWWEAHMPQATQAQAWAAWTAALNCKGATIEAPQKATPADNTDVHTILLDVVPGPGGMGLEVFAKSVDDVVAKLTELDERGESLRTQVDLLTAAVEARGRKIATLKATPEPVALGPLAQRTIFDAIRSAYDLGYNDARNAFAVPGDSAPGYKGRDVEADHGGALFNTLARRLRNAATPEPVGEPRGWAPPTEAEIDEYLEDYEMHGNDEDGRDACHTPTEGERILIKDAILGLLADTRPAPAAQAVPMTWPKARDVGRFGDMDPMDHIRVGLDSDNDVYVSVWGKDGGASVEFCNPGGGGGGSSRRTREALIALMVAMEADNAERPDKDWWARRTAQAEGGA